MNEEAFIESFKAAHPEPTLSSEVLRRGKVSLVVKKEGLLETARSLKNDFGFNHPVSAGAIDYPKEDRMQMMYYLFNPSSKFMVVFRVDLPREELKTPTLTQVWEAMSFHERETHEMFGIEFEGHPNMIPLLLPPDWKGGHPLRKDFKGEGVIE